jgi:nicotinate-nucleotide pyrophosphorylase (carboxylating)
MSTLARTSTPSEVDTAELQRIVAIALDEDLRLGPDVTTQACVPADARGTGVLAARAPGVVAGIAFAHAALAATGGTDAVWEMLVDDGAPVAAGQPICTIDANLQALLTAERTMLNFLTHLSGIATLTAQWVAAVAGTGAQIRDTRKTIPGMRMAEKYAVRCGGGVNHRMALGDAALIKDNHIVAAGSMTAAISRVRERAPGIALEVECDTLDQVREAMSCAAAIILLDNMPPATMRKAVQLREAGSDVLFEASGGLSLDNARAVADTGVDYLAIGALTHSAAALDIGLDLR